MQDKKSQKILLEVFTANGCGRCQVAKNLAMNACQYFGDDVLEWRELNVVEHIDYAVKYKLLYTPAIVLDREHVFRSLPDEADFFNTITAYLKNSKHVIHHI